jgi:hypothetical protein
VQYIQKKPKNNGLFDDWLADFDRKNAGFGQFPFRSGTPKAVQVALPRAMG